MKATKEQIIKKIVDIDVELSNNRFDHHLTPEESQKLRIRRERLERQLYK